MSKHIGPALLLIIGAIIFMLILTTLNDSQTQKNNSRANLVIAQGQARLDAAQAFTIIMLTALPYVAIIAISGGVVCVFMFTWPNRNIRTEEKRIETINYIILPMSGQSSREIYKQLPDKIKQLRN